MNNWNSKRLTRGGQQGIRAFYYGLGWTDEDFDKPLVGIGTPLHEINLCNRHSLELGEAHWVFGQRRWQQTGTNQVLAVGSQGASDILLAIDLERESVAVVDYDLSTARHLYPGDTTGPVMVLGHSAKGSEIVQYDVSSRQISVLLERSKEKDTIATSLPTQIQFKTGDASQAYGVFYPPLEIANRPMSGDLPPLMVPRSMLVQPPFS